MTKVYFIRHARTEANAAFLTNGQGEMIPNAEGMKQIELLGERFKNIEVDAVYSSPLYRAMLTATAVSRPKGLKIIKAPDFLEMDFGLWESNFTMEMERKYKPERDAFRTHARDFRIPGGESFQEVIDRMVGGMLRLAKENDGKTIAIVSHGFAIGCMMEAIFEKDLPHQENTAVSLFEVEGENIKPVFVGDASHLDSVFPPEQRKNQFPMDDPRRYTWMRPAKFPEDEELIAAFHKDAWQKIYGSLEGYDREEILSESRRMSRANEKAVFFMMHDETESGMMELDTCVNDVDGVGHIAFVYIRPEMRHKKLGDQLIMRATTFYRGLGREFLRLRVAPGNTSARSFYKRLGFYEIGQESEGHKLILLRRDIAIPQIDG